MWISWGAHTRKLMRPLRDLVFDHTPFLQKVIGYETPGHILKQLEEIEDVPPERR